MKKNNHTRIPAARAEYGLTQEDLAQAVGTCRQEIHNIERGKTTPGLSIMLKISMYLKRNIEYLLKQLDDD